MLHEDITRLMLTKGYVRTLFQQEELPLLRDHLLRLDPVSYTHLAPRGRART